MESRRYKTSPAACRRPGLSPIGETGRRRTINAHGIRLVGPKLKCPCAIPIEARQLSRAREDDLDGEGAAVTPVEIAVPDELDLMGAELPSKYEGAGIAKVVKSFGKSRDMGDTEMMDLFQEACAAATVAIADAEAKGGSTEAFVKVAVKRRLTDLIRRFDAVAPWEVHAEDGPREADADPNERLVENLPDPKYRPSRRRRVDAVRLAALLVSPQAQRYCQAFRETVAESSDEKAKKRILQVVAQAGREGISRNELTRKTQFLRKQFRDEYLDDLIEGGELRRGTNSKGGVMYYPEL